MLQGGGGSRWRRGPGSGRRPATPAALFPFPSGSALPGRWLMTSLHACVASLLYRACAATPGIGWPRPCPLEHAQIERTARVLWSMRRSARLRAQGRRSFHSAKAKPRPQWWRMRSSAPPGENGACAARLSFPERKCGGGSSAHAHSARSAPEVGRGSGETPFPPLPPPGLRVPACSLGAYRTP